MTNHWERCLTYMGNNFYTFTLSHFQFHFHIFTFTLSLSHFRFHTFTLTHSHFHVNTFTLSLSHFQVHTFTFTRSLLHFHTFTLSLSMTLMTIITMMAMMTLSQDAMENTSPSDLENIFTYIQILVTLWWWHPCGEVWSSRMRRSMWFDQRRR